MVWKKDYRRCSFKIVIGITVLAILLLANNASAKVNIMTNWGFSHENDYNDIILQEITEVWGDTQPTLDPLFVKALVATESGFDKDATNGNYCGLMQTKCSYDYSKIHAGTWNDPRTAIHVGITVLREKMVAMNSPSIWYDKGKIGDVGTISPPGSTLELWNYVFDAYNAGQGTMGNAMAYARQMGKNELIWQNIVEPQDDPTQSPLYKAVLLNGWGISKYNEIKEYIIGTRGTQHWLSLYYKMVMPVDGMPIPAYSFYPTDDNEPGRTGDPRSWYSVVYRGKYNGLWSERGEGSGSHPGVDIRVESGTPVKSITDGVVIKSEDNNGWGGLVVIKHTNIPGAQNGDPIYSIYAHLKRRDVSVTDKVSKNQVIGLSGGDKNDPNHGWATGAHLHFQIDRDKKADTGDSFISPYWPKSYPPNLDPSKDDKDTDGIIELYTYNPIKLIERPSLDLVFLIDTTGSMGDDIGQVKLSANEIVNTLDVNGFDWRVAVADYKDYHQWPYGGSTDYVYKLDLPFTTKDNKQNIVNAINGLYAYGGADGPEAVYSALVNTMTDKCKDCINNADNFGWRKGVTKVIIQMGDAPPHMPIEPWPGGYALNDVISTSKSIDPVIVYSVAIGSDRTAYSAFSEIANGTGGKVYTSPTASDIVDTLIEVIGDIGKPTTSCGVSVNITPALNETSPGGSASYSANITNQGNVNDTYNLSLELKSFTGFYRSYPVAIQPSWVAFDNSAVGLDPSVSEIRPLAINVPTNWAGMEDTTYSFNVTAKSETDATISNTSSAELKVKANKKSMAEYSKLEVQWLSELVNGSGIDQGIKNALLAKLANADSKLDQAINNIDGGKIKPANNMLSASQNMISAFINQVEAQYDKKIMQPDAAMLEEKANQILQDIEKAKNT